jgi:hypothetical protein
VDRPGFRNTCASFAQVKSTALPSPCSCFNLRPGPTTSDGFHAREMHVLVPFFLRCFNIRCPSLMLPVASWYSQFYHRWEVKLNVQLMGMTARTIKPLDEATAVKTGAEILGEGQKNGSRCVCLLQPCPFSVLPSDMCTCLHVCLYVCMHVWICMHARMHGYVCVLF